MRTEIFKIIEGGLNADKDRVSKYTQLLIKNLQEEGDIKSANKLQKILAANNTRLVGLDTFTNKPVDSDSRLEMVNVTLPNQSLSNLKFERFIEVEINEFINGFERRAELQELNLDHYNKLLLYGKPGTGKTSLAQKISNELGLPLVTARLDALVSSLLGNTSKNIRKIFDYAQKQPCVLFLDEFDVIAKIRDDKNELGELKRVVNSLLQNIDTFDSDSILIAATNHQFLLDPAVWRRFNKVIEMPLPSENIRKQLLIDYEIELNNDYSEDNKKLENLIKLTENLSPSEINTLLINVAKKAVLSGTSEILYTNLLYEIFLSKNNGNITEESLLSFLLQQNLTQKEINQNYNIPLRKIRNFNKDTTTNI